MNSIDKWAAEKCGVVLGYVPNHNGHGTRVWVYKGVTNYWAWTIKNPRCREMFRNWWLNAGTMRQVCFSDHSVMYVDYEVGDTAIAHELHSDGGEEACIKTIVENSHGNGND